MLTVIMRPILFCAQYRHWAYDPLSAPRVAWRWVGVWLLLLHVCLLAPAAWVRRANACDYNASTTCIPALQPRVPKTANLCLQTQT